MTLNLRHAAAIAALIAFPAGSLAAQTVSSGTATSADRASTVTVFRGAGGAAASGPTSQTTVFHGSSAPASPTAGTGAERSSATVVRGSPHSGTGPAQGR